MKTNEQWLNELPEPVRSLALKNMWWEDKDSQQPDQATALRQSFNWSRSPEGTAYWQGVYDIIKKST